MKSRKDLYLEYLVNGGNVDDLPIPESRTDSYLYNLCIVASQGGGTGGNGGSVNVINNLISLSTSSALSAYQGKVLNDKIDELNIPEVSKICINDDNVAISSSFIRNIIYFSPICTSLKFYKTNANEYISYTEKKLNTNNGTLSSVGTNFYFKDFPFVQNSIQNVKLNTAIQEQPELVFDTYSNAGKIAIKFPLLSDIFINKEDPNSLFLCYGDGRMQMLTLAPGTLVGLEDVVSGANTSINRNIEVESNTNRYVYDKEIGEYRVVDNLQEELENYFAKEIKVEETEE